MLPWTVILATAHALHAGQSMASLTAPAYTHSIDSLANILGGTGRARLVWERLRHGIDPLSEDADPVLSPRVLDTLRERTAPPTGQIVGEPAVSSCGTRKLLLRLADETLVELVLIPTFAHAGAKPTSGYTTLCLSSQVGCRQACRFCATGTMGLRRSLGLDEVIAQLYEALALVRREGLPPLRNIVFMGMGEPLDNADVVQAALELMTGHLTFGLSKKAIAVSTVGPSPEHIDRMVHMPARLAWSVHAADDELRRLLVPTTRHTMCELRDAFADVLRRRPDGHGLMVECTMIDGVNDQPAHADQLLRLLAPLPGKTKVNLIPYNANAGLGAAGELFQPSRPDAIEAFKRRIMDAGVVCTRRRTRGDEKASACGQLVTGR